MPVAAALVRCANVNEGRKSMSVIESVREFILGCPFLAEGKLNVNHLGAEPPEYVILRVETDEILKKYSDGGTLKQFDFIFGSRERVGGRVKDHLAIADFYERLAEWIAQKDGSGELPRLEEGKTAQAISVLAPGVMRDQTGDSARYQLRCRLIYFEGGERHGK